MNRTAPHRRSLTLVGTCLVAALAIGGLSGCGKDDKTSTKPNPNPTPSPTTYTGIVTGSTTSGKLVVTLADTATVPGRATRAFATLVATGTFTLSGGEPITLTGTYDDAAHTFTVTGGGWTFGGTLSGTALSGTFTGPGGVTGVFTLQQGTTGVIVIIGTFTSTSGSSNGRFNFSISGATVSGYGMADGGSTIPLNGTYNATSGAISIRHPANPTGAPLATGTYNSTSGVASGTYDDQDANSGNWTGNRQ